MTRVPNEGKGDCVFLALAQASAEVRGGKPRTAIQLRAACVSHLHRHEARYKQYWDEKAPDERETTVQEWKAYLDLLAKRGAWAGYLEIGALAATMDGGRSRCATATAPDTTSTVKAAQDTHGSCTRTATTNG